MTAANDWPARIVQRFAGTQPRRELGGSHVAGVAAKYDALFRAAFPDTPVAAAVLVPIVEREPEPTVLLTVRASDMRRHAGQIAFPGGRIEATDASPDAAALREAWEEIGLPPGQSRVVGYLPDHLVVTGYRVTPVVALVRPGFTLAYDAREVADSFEVPLSHLFDPRNHRLQARTLRGQEVEVHEILFGERNIWGATAGMLINLYHTMCEERVA